jgi:hypothetical protein
MGKNCPAPPGKAKKAEWRGYTLLAQRPSPKGADCPLGTPVHGRLYRPARIAALANPGPKDCIPWNPAQPCAGWMPPKLAALDWQLMEPCPPIPPCPESGGFCSGFAPQNRRTHYAPEIRLVVKSRASSLRPSPRRNMESPAITTRKMKRKERPILGCQFCFLLARTAKNQTVHHSLSAAARGVKRLEAKEKHGVSQPNANTGAGGTGCGTVNYRTVVSAIGLSISFWRWCNASNPSAQPSPKQS